MDALRRRGVRVTMVGVVAIIACMLGARAPVDAAYRSMPSDQPRQLTH